MGKLTHSEPHTHSQHNGCYDDVQGYVIVRGATARTSAFNGSKCVARTTARTSKVSLRVRCEATEPKVSEPEVSAPEPVVVSPVEPESAANTDQIDPLDGTVQYGKALGNTGDDLLSNAMSVFAGGNASEVINGRAAMVGFTAALLAELSSGQSVFTQMYNVRDVGVKTILLPKMGFFLIPATVVLVMMSSFAPQLRGKKENGLNVPAEPVGPFTPSAETINGRAAMIGLVALVGIEAVSGTALF